MERRRNTYSYYQTNYPNILGGYMTYSSLERAIQACEGGRGTKVYICTIVRHNNNLGINVQGALCKMLWRDLIWQKKN